MTHREVLEAMSGLMLAMFVAVLSSTVVTTALPVIISDLDGTESGYTWVMVSTLLALTATTPIWGKVADLANKKLLVQIALVVYTLGSVLAGFATSMETLIAARVVQGVGVGGLTALVQIVIASIVSPRERGRYTGYLGAVFAVATVSGPLIGGLIVDTIGWRWCFGVSVPVAALAFVVLQRTLHLPTVRRQARIDYVGAVLVAGGLSTLLAWVSLVGSSFPLLSLSTAIMVGAGGGALVALVFVERRVAEPMIPLQLFADRTITLAVIASLAIGVAMFGSTLFLSQYFQLGHGMSPTEAGLMTLPLVLGLLVTSILTGRLISRYGSWKRYLVGGAALMVVGLGLLALLDSRTPLAVAGGSMLVLGLGIGALQQNLILAVQNSVPHSEVGAASSLVATFRTMGGAVGVAVLGTALSHRVTDHVAAGLARLGLPADGEGHREIPDLSELPGPVREVFMHAFGEATGHVFLLALPAAVLALAAVLLVREVPLRTTIHRRRAGGGMSMDPELIRELETQMGVVVRRVRRVVAERAAGIDPDLGAVGYAVIDQLALRGPCRQSDLVGALSSEKGAVSRAVQQLVDLGLAVRQDDPDDGRACVVALSGEGRRRLDALVRRRRTAYAEKLADWSPAELEEFVRLLGRYNDSLEG